MLTRALRIIIWNIAMKLFLLKTNFVCESRKLAEEAWTGRYEGCVPLHANIRCSITRSAALSKVDSWSEAGHDMADCALRISRWPRGLVRASNIGAFVGWSLAAVTRRQSPEACSAPQQSKELLLAAAPRRWGWCQGGRKGAFFLPTVRLPQNRCKSNLLAADLFSALLLLFFPLCRPGKNGHARSSVSVAILKRALLAATLEPPAGRPYAR